MEDDHTHIERCRVCNGPINILHRASWIQDANGRYRHNTPHCAPSVSAEDRAARYWGRTLTLQPQAGNGLASR